MDLPESFLLSHAEYHIENNTPHIIISDDNEFRCKLEQLDNCLKTISRGRKLPFTILYNRSGYKESAESAIILDAIRHLNMLPQDAMKVRIANPRIATFQRLFNSADLYSRVHNGKIVGADTVTTAEMLNKLMQDYRFTVSQAGFKQACRKYQRTSVKNLKGVINYIRHLQERHSGCWSCGLIYHGQMSIKLTSLLMMPVSIVSSCFAICKRIQCFAMSSGRYGNWNMAHNVNFITTCYLS